MQEFYKKSLLAFLVLMAASMLVAYLCLQRSYLNAPLLPGKDSPIPWRLMSSSDASRGGKSSVQIQDDPQRLRFDLNVATSVDYPFAGVVLAFQDRLRKPLHVDLSHYSSVSLSVKCSPANTLMLSVPTFDRRISKRDQILSYRTPSAYFSCNENGSRVELDLTRMETQQWWFDMFKLDISHRAYKLDQVPRIEIGSTFQSPRNIVSRVDIDVLELNGRDRRYLAFATVLLALAWTGFGIWFFRQHSLALIGDVKNKLQKDLPFVAYQQLSLEPHRDREKTAILRLIATSYAKPDLDLERVVAETGVNRNKVNDILKAELGFTFSGYLNKLRLTEAARLLAEKSTATVAEIAYSVGYSNVSYFNKLFKEEYGCTPKVFRSACAPPG